MNATESDKTYNGWTNYETWNVKLWMDNDQASCNGYAAMAQEAYDEAGDGLSAYAKFAGREIFTRKERAALLLSGKLKTEYEEASEQILEQSGQTASVWADLLGAALSEVNWKEIADSLLEDVSDNSSTDDEEE
jgi:hypothetical protein